MVAGCRPRYIAKPTHLTTEKAGYTPAFFLQIQQGNTMSDSSTSPGALSTRFHALNPKEQAVFLNAARTQLERFCASFPIVTLSDTIGGFCVNCYVADIKGTVVVETHPLGDISKEGAISALSFDDAYCILSPFVPSHDELSALIEHYQRRVDCFKDDALAAVNNADWDTLSSVTASGKLASETLKKLRTSRENHHMLKC